MGSVLLTPSTQPDDHTSIPNQSSETHEPKSLLHGLGLNIFPKEPIDLPIARRWNAATWQHSFRHTADYNHVHGQYGEVEVKRQEAILLLFRTEQTFVQNLQHQLDTVGTQLERMMATRHAHTRTAALPRLRRIIAETLQIHKSFLDKMRGGVAGAVSMCHLVCAQDA